MGAGVHLHWKFSRRQKTEAGEGIVYGIHALSPKFHICFSSAVHFLSSCYLFRHWGGQFMENWHSPLFYLNFIKTSYWGNQEIHPSVFKQVHERAVHTGCSNNSGRIDSLDKPNAVFLPMSYHRPLGLWTTYTFVPSWSRSENPTWPFFESMWKG